MNSKLKLLLCLLSSTITSLCFSQDDLLSMLDSLQGAEPATHDKVSATFKTTKVVNAHTTETVKAGTMDFRVTHRFGNIGAMSGGGVHSLYGLDAANDIRISFDFGITDKLMLGIARNKRQEAIDGLIKWRLMEQTTDNHVPFSFALYSDAALTPVTKEQLYSGTENVTYKFAHRLSYTTQMIIARKFGWRFSFELLPTYQYRNFVKDYINTDNLAHETNGMVSIGAAMRLKLTKRFAIIADYFYTISDYRTNNPNVKYYAPMALGIEIETGGHVFHLDFTNSAGIIENDFIPNTTDDWFKGGFKFGFNISRVFNIVKR